MSLRILHTTQRTLNTPYLSQKRRDGFLPRRSNASFIATMSKGFVASPRLTQVLCFGAITVISTEACALVMDLIDGRNQRCTVLFMAAVDQFLLLFLFKR